MNCSSCGERIRGGSKVTPIYVPPDGYESASIVTSDVPIPRMNDQVPPWGEHPNDFDFRELCENCAAALNTSAETP